MPANRPFSTSYDEVPYPSYTHPQTHPDRLAVVGKLYGLKPAPTSRCRVLELGAGDGSNLIPMAWGLPESEFVGIDLAGSAVDRGAAMIRELGLPNVRLIQAGIEALPAGLGEFDFIIAHGVYSWVPTAVQSGLLRSCRQHLSAHGIAFVSYNALPGCHARNMVREMLLFHVREIEHPADRVNQALALARFLADAQVPDVKDEYRVWMRAELQEVLGHEPGHLFHDELSELNEPLFFTQFVERAGEHQLQYLGEADYFEMHDHGFQADARRTLSQLARNRVLREQYLDFLKCRRFRQTLLCRGEVQLCGEPSANPVSEFYISSKAICEAGPADLRPGVAAKYETAKGGVCETDFALGKAALAELETVWPVPMGFEELLAKARARLSAAGLTAEGGVEAREALRGFLLQLFGAGVVEFRTALPPVACGVSERPMASPVIRWQAKQGKFVASLFHVPVKVEDEIGRSLLGWLDGTRDRSALLDEIWPALKSSNPGVSGNEAEARRELLVKLESNLAKLARLGLLAG